MTIRVRVKMSSCGNTSDISVSGTIDGRFIVMMNDTTCEKAKSFVGGIRYLTPDDLIDKKKSKVFRNFIDSEMSANCLVPSGVLTAAWAEAGMIAPSARKKGEPSFVEFIN
ncbi:MAG: hypothetical protein GX137_05585 [Thermoplasmatales archaeon]|jgi:hypothetical protein|nr:hypothetical protein [Thermoplasmatales archaeon]